MARLHHIHTCFPGEPLADFCCVLRQIHATENWDFLPPNQRLLILLMVPDEDQNIPNTELYFQMAGLINECELHKNNFSEKTLELATVFGICRPEKCTV